MTKNYYTQKEIAKLIPGFYPTIEGMLNSGELSEQYVDGERVVPAETINDFILGRPIGQALHTQEPLREADVDRELWSKDLSLYPWQREALEWWRKRRYRGVIEAVTGAGKTRGALAAVEHHLRHGGDRVVVIVPTKELLYQWKRETEKMLVEACGMRVSIGLLGDGHKNMMRSATILLATVQTARNHRLLPVAQIWQLCWQAVGPGARWCSVWAE